MRQMSIRCDDSLPIRVLLEKSLGMSVFVASTNAIIVRVFPCEQLGYRDIQHFSKFLPGPMLAD